MLTRIIKAGKYVWKPTGTPETHSNRYSRAGRLGSWMGILSLALLFAVSENPIFLDNACAFGSSNNENSLDNSPTTSDYPGSRERDLLVPGSQITLALIGDSITRGVLANMSLGDTAQFQDYLLVAQLLFGARTVALMPEGEGALNWKLMRSNEILARDHLAAVQGNTSYSLVNRFAERGINLDVINVAQLGGSYRTAEGQIALLQTEVLKRQRLGEPEVDAVIVDLGRIDFSFFTETEDFKSQVNSFFTKLLQVVPRAKILVTRIAEIPRILDRPDRVGMYLFGGRPVNCSEVFRDKIATRTKLVPGQDNSAAIGPAIVQAKVEELRAAGVTADWITTLPDRSDPETWDELLASDCIHINQTGQEQVAGVYERALSRLLSYRSDNSSGSAGVKSSPTLKTVAPAQWSPKAEQLWLEYTQSLQGLNLQKGCEPRLWKEKTPLQGTVLLYHGFTACPQQYDELAELLAQAGYRVVVPLLPGHGLEWSIGPEGAKKDDIRFLPQGILKEPYDYQKEYLGLVDRMNRLFAQIEGPRSVAGLSVGASLATLGTILRADLWDRQLILSPLYEIGQLPIRTVFGSISNTQRQLQDLLKYWNPILNQEMGWGQGCENERDPEYVARYGRSEIRAGICQFKFTHAAGSNQIGYEAWETIRPTMVQTQVVGVADDLLINQQLIFNGAGKMRNEELEFLPYKTKERFNEHPTIRVCYIPSDNQICLKNSQLPIDEQEKPCVNHSLLSRFDSPDQNKYWINPLNKKIVDFIVYGNFLPAQTAESVHGDPLCKGF
jgi:alpha-beta hydrolase superfamily lysophospholipase